MSQKQIESIKCTCVYVKNIAKNKENLYANQSTQEGVP